MPGQRDLGLAPGTSPPFGEDSAWAAGRVFDLAVSSVLMTLARVVALRISMAWMLTGACAIPVGGKMAADHGAGISEERTRR